jgi:hypothetical protein
MQNPFRHNQAPDIPEPTPLTLDDKLAALDAEAHRWEAMIEGTSTSHISTAQILGGLASVEARRAALLENQDYSPER